MNEKFPVVVENEDVDGAMPQLACMDFNAECLADHPIGFVHDIEDLIWWLHEVMKA